MWHLISMHQFGCLFECHWRRGSHQARLLPFGLFPFVLSWWGPFLFVLLRCAVTMQDVSRNRSDIVSLSAFTAFWKFSFWFELIQKDFCNFTLTRTLLTHNQFRNFVLTSAHYLRYQHMHTICQKVACKVTTLTPFRYICQAFC